MEKSYRSLISAFGFIGVNPNQLSILVFSTMLLLSAGLFAQSPIAKQQIQSKSNLAKLSQLQTDFSKKAISQKQAALDAAKKNGWQVRMTNPDGSISEIQKMVNGQPIYYTTFNVDAARSTRTNHLNIGGSLGLNLDGQNMTAHVWDGGHARASHQEYDGPGGNNRVSVEDAASEGGVRLNFHAAHVTGTIVASGVQAAAKGMAPQAKVKGYMWNNDIAEATTAAANGMIVSNHSYGFRGDLVPDQYFGAYIGESRAWDQVMFNAPFYLMVVAAGNDGNQNGYNGAPLDGNSSYDKLTGHSTSKNNLVVANAQDANVSSNGTLVSVSINSSSSEGPTDDYRIKPDITGNGTGVYSTYESSNTAYRSITGTSMASPNVAGSLLLLQQHYNNVNGNLMRAATLKGLALHTADDIGPAGPDAVHGWGLLNAKAAAEAITNAASGESKVEELTLSSGQTYTVTVDSDGTNPLLASISWTDRPGTATTATNSNTPVLVNDLDIRVTKGSTTNSPYRLTGITTNGKGDNKVDPFERVDVANASGTYTITVTHKGSLTGGSQNFSLVVTGLTGTPIVCNATVPAGTSSSAVGSTSATINWNEVAGATYDVRYRATGTSSWTTVAATGTSQALSSLTASTSYEAQVRSKCADGTTSSYSSSVTFTTTAVQLNYCASNGNSVSDEYISRVQLGTINNASSAGAGGYSDFTSIATSLAKGSTNTITVTPTWTGTLYNEAYSVWIDYNQDGDFADAGEQVWTQSPTQTTPVSGTFTVPASAQEGNTRMRVSMKYNALPTSCESFQYGEVEDYTVTIGGSGGGGNPTCTNGISSFPYGEGFENTLGAWSQSSADDINWTVDANGTPSRGTGPSSATQGSYYIFVEASGNGTGYPNKRAIIESPCFDLSNVSNASFKFNYHMYGAADMGSIDLEVSTDEGASWTSIWSQTGNKGNSWQAADIDLASYVGGGVKLRFNRVTGSTWQADIAIDNVSLTSTNGNTNICAGVSEWSNTRAYQPGDLVTYQGSLFERTATGWNNLGTCNTSASLAINSIAKAPPINTGILKQDLSIYPNPVVGTNLNIIGKSSGEYTIINIMGQIIDQGTFTNNIINVQEGLPRGPYILKVGTQITRFIKN